MKFVETFVNYYVIYKLPLKDTLKRDYRKIYDNQPNSHFTKNLRKFEKKSCILF